MTAKLLSRCSSFHVRYISFLPFLQHPFLLLIRLYWGFDFVQTGLGKLNNLEGTTEFFSSLGIPFPALQAMLVGNIEMIGGVLVMIGLGARYFTLPLIGILGVAFLTDDREALMNIAADPESFVNATPFLHLYSLLTVYLFGAGSISADAVVQRWMRKNRQR